MANILSIESYVNYVITKREICSHKSNVLTGAGFEPAPPKWLVPETSALDHSAILPLYPRSIFHNLSDTYCVFTHLKSCSVTMRLIKKTTLLYLLITFNACYSNPIPENGIKWNNLVGWNNSSDDLKRWIV